MRRAGEIEITELQSEAEFKEAFPVMKELRSYLTEAQFLKLLLEMRAGGYRLFALRASGEIVSLAGIRISTNFRRARHVWVDDLVTAAKARSSGYGKILLRHIEDFAGKEGCGMIALSSGVRRKDAHRFYEKHMRYKRVSHLFEKTFSEPAEI
jgi:GNAT superfamily N-acetyltransferase